MTRILVAFGSKHGSTAEVATAIADRLGADGHGVDLFPVDIAPGPEGYDGVVLGGSIYMGRWHEDARKYLLRHRGELSGSRLAVFALGPKTMADVDVAASLTQLCGALAKTPELTPVLVEVFGGVVRPDRLHFPLSRMVASDARDWPAIDAWTREAARRFGSPSADEKGPVSGAFPRADEETRTLDLLHGKQTL